MVTRLADGLWHVDCETLDRPNVFLVEDGDLTLVDAGWPGDEATVRGGVEDAGYALGSIDRVLLTHADADHVGTLSRLTPELDAPVYLHPREAPLLRGERLPPWTARPGFGAFHRLYYRRLTLPDLPIRTVTHGEAIGGFRAYHTPGHTPGHLVYTHAEVDAAFLGDLAYGWRDGLRLTGRLTSYDTAENRGSIESFLDRCPSFEYACAGHGPVVEDGHERLAEAIA